MSKPKVFWPTRTEVLIALLDLHWPCGEGLSFHRLKNQYEHNSVAKSSMSTISISTNLWVLKGPKNSLQAPRMNRRIGMLDMSPSAAAFKPPEFQTWLEQSSPGRYLHHICHTMRRSARWESEIPSLPTTHPSGTGGGKPGGGGRGGGIRGWRWEASP